MFGRIAVGVPVLGLVLASGTAYAAAAPTPAASAPTVYVADAPLGVPNGGKVVPVDSVTHTAGQPIAAGDNPSALAITP